MPEENTTPRADKAATAQPETTLKIPCEVWSRIVGYMRPVNAWNAGKQQEFADRKTFRVEQKREDNSV